MIRQLTEHEQVVDKQYENQIVSAIVREERLLKACRAFS